MATASNSPILRFYSGIGPDHRGRYLRDMLDWDDVQLESTHDYIQWLFPTSKSSGFNPYAPVLTPDDMAQFRGSDELKSNLREAFVVMLRFYGFQLQESEIQPSADWESRSTIWLRPDNHNHLRITRILTALSFLGCHDLAAAFLAALEKIGDDAISKETRTFWRRAVRHS